EQKQRQRELLRQLLDYRFVHLVHATIQPRPAMPAGMRRTCSTWVCMLILSEEEGIRSNKSTFRRETMNTGLMRYGHSPYTPSRNRTLLSRVAHSRWLQNPSMIQPRNPQRLGHKECFSTDIGLSLSEAAPRGLSIN